MGYTLHVSFEGEISDEHTAEILLGQIQKLVPLAVLPSFSPNGSAYHLHSKDSKIFKDVFEVIQAEKARLGIGSYEIHSH
jgi:hypothetical protein